MKIRTQLIAGIVVFALLLVIISGFTIATNQQIDTLIEEEELANSIALGIGELGYLSNDYILYRESIHEERWNAKFAAISRDIARLSPDQPEQQAIVADLASDLRNTRSVFNDIAGSPVRPGGSETSFVQLSWSRMAVQNQGMIFDAGRLARIIRTQADELRQTRFLLILALSGVFGAFLLTSYFLFYRRTLKSINDLQEGARIIGSGNLDHTIEERADDEITELSRSFNRMTADLKTVIASRAELEREVAGRKKAEEELIHANDQLIRSGQDLVERNADLNALNEELTATQEELIRANEQLVRSGQDLAERNTDLNALNEELTATQEELQQNVDELIRAEQELRKSREKYRNLFETMSEGFAVHEIVCDDDGKPADYRFLNINPAFETLTGLNRCEVLGKRVTEVLPGTEPFWIQRYGAVALTGIPDHFSSYSAALDRYYDVTAYSPAPLQFAVLFTDVTDRRLAEKALRESEDKFRKLVKYAPSSIYEMDLAGTKFLSVNDKMCEILGYTREELLSLRPGDLLDKESRALFRERVGTKLSGGKIAEPVEYRIRKKNGEWIYTAVSVGSFDYAAERPDRVVVVAHDITGRKLMEKEMMLRNEALDTAYRDLAATQAQLHRSIEELTEREVQLQGALSEKDALLSEIHHRVKNNLAAFISLLSLDGTYEETEGGRALRKDLQNRARSMALIHETLYRTGKFSNVEMETYLSTLTLQIAASYAGQAPVQLRIDARGVVLDLARATSAGLIVNELVTNSYKYAFPPGFDCMAERNEPCTIRVRFTREDGTYLLSVSDNGRGLPADYDPLTAKSLGLKLVNFLGRHQLRADILVRREKGTEFIFRLQNSGETG